MILKNYIKTSMRNLKRNKGYAFINISGLAIGVFSFVMIMLFVRWEYSYDNFYPNADRIYRIGVDGIMGNTEIKQVYTPAPLPAAIYETFPQVEAITRIDDIGTVDFEIDNQKFMADNVFLVDSTFPQIFSLDVLEGNPDNMLVEPYSIVLSESYAKRFFGNDRPYLNKTIQSFDDEYRISGVFKDIPENTHFNYDMLVSLTSYPDHIRNNGWFNNNFHCYLLLQDKYPAQELQNQLPDLISTYMFTTKSYDEYVAEGNKWEYYLQPLQTIHLDSDLWGEFEPNGQREYIELFVIISIFILIIACINFMNLSTAKSSQRSKEVAVRKVYGANRNQLIIQFLGESFVFTLLSLILAMAMVESLLPIFRNYIGKPIEINYFENFYTLPLLFLITVFIGLLSGSYPAFYLSSFNPVRIFHGKTTKKNGNVAFRNLLVIFQFSISIFLIAGSIIVTRQLYFLQNKNLGFDKEQVLVVENGSFLGDNARLFKQEIEKIAGVEAVTLSNTLPGKFHNNIGVQPEGMEQTTTINMCGADDDYMEVLKFNIVKGRFFSENFASDTTGIVVNEATLRAIGWENDIDKIIKIWIGSGTDYQIIGVMEDFHYESKHQEVRPMAVVMRDRFNWSANYISLRLNTEDARNIVNQVENKWQNFADELPLTYSFLDDTYDNLYRNEAQTRNIFGLFSILSVFVASLGLFALASFIAERRTKEIGIRKSMGASTGNITRIFLTGFVRWVLIAGVIAIPLTFLSMKEWLQNFAYRINLTGGAFVVAIAIAIAIAVFTVLFQTLKAARHNPVDSLRYE